MSESIPPAEVLLDACARYVDEELSPTLAGYHRYQTRILGNLLRILAREMRSRRDPANVDSADIAALLGTSGDPQALDVMLAQSIRQGDFDLRDLQLRAHLKASLRAALAINNPRWAQPEEKGTS